MPDLSPEKRVLLASALSILVLLGWSAYIRNVYPPPESSAGETLPAATQPVPAEALPPPAEAAPEQPAPVPVGQAREATEERTITVETDLATIVLSNRGAVIQSWTLKAYRDKEGKPLELVRNGETNLGYPLSLSLSNPDQEELINQALFQVDTSATLLTAPAELVFEWSNGQLAVRKRFRFEDGYRSEVEAQVLDGGELVEHRLAWRGGFGETTAEPAAARGTEAQVFVRTPAGLKRQPARLAGQETGWLFKSPSPFPYSGPASYAGIEDRYFVVLFLPRRPRLSVQAWTRSWTPADEEKERQVGVVAVGGPDTGPLRLFVGPKAIDVLERIQAPTLPGGRVPVVADELVDFGWFWWVAKPLFLAMKWMYEQWIPNYGWVIVLLTVIINTLLFPLKWKSMQSAWKMQKLAPQMKAIQAKYKQYKFNDPRKQQMQQEMMALYKQHGVNPLGGCFPLLVQLPFFYGFYKVLAIAIEMRHAPWMLWIRDLSQKDPYFVLPIVMALTMFISTRMTPMTTADPAQQRMMRFLPLLFGFFFLQVSAGLVLYWLMSSVVGIAQQWWINKRQREQELAEKLAAKERKKKKRKLQAGEPGQ